MEAARNRRRENAVELRRTKKNEQMMKRRNIVEDEKTAPLTPSLTSNSSSNISAVTLAELPHIINTILYGSDKQAVFEAVRGARYVRTAMDDTSFS